MRLMISEGHSCKMNILTGRTEKNNKECHSGYESGLRIKQPFINVQKNVNFSNTMWVSNH